MLNPTQLADQLAQQWLSDDNGPHPDTVPASADAFSNVVSQWFMTAEAAGVPVVTAMPRQPMLMALTVPALMAQAPEAAGQQLANGLMLYMTGQVYGAGVSAPPIATAAAGAMIGNAFRLLDLDRRSRAQMIATAVHIMTLTTIVSFPHPPFAAPVN